MGYIGDVYGRKLALELSIWIMALPTFALGCLPSFEQVGWWSPIGLIAVRLLQGLSVGGQLMSSLIYVADRCPDPQRHLGYHCSFVCMSANVGILLGGLVALALRMFLSWDQLTTWGWRLPFLAGGIFVSVSGLALKHSGEAQIETDDHANSKNPIRGAFSRTNLPSLLSSIAVVSLWGSGFYLVFVWLAIFMEDLVHPAVPHAFFVNSMSMALSGCIFFPMAGWLSDIYGRQSIMLVGGISLAVLGPICLQAISAATASSSLSPVAVTMVGLIAQTLLGMGVSLWGAPMLAWLVERFPPSIRLTSVAVGYNTAMCVAGGLAPAVATILADRCGPVGPGLLFTFVAPIALIGLFWSPPMTSQKPAMHLDSDCDSNLTDDGVEGQ
jgi:MHS family proline/betaine transporter-like MFS transporter